jgi:hypothetical protein
MTKPRNLLSLALGLSICAVMMASAYAATNTYITDVLTLPGVDKFGNLDLNEGNKCRYKVIVDTSSRTFVARAKCQDIHNWSGKSHIFYDRVAIGLQPFAQKMNVPASRIRITKDEYHVDKGDLLHHTDGYALVTGELRPI